MNSMCVDSLDNNFCWFNMKGTEQALHSCLEQRISITVCWIRDYLLNTILQTWAPMLVFNNNLVWIVRDMVLVLFLLCHGLGVHWESPSLSARCVVVQLVHPCAGQWGSELSSPIFLWVSDCIVSRVGTAQGKSHFTHSVSTLMAFRNRQPWDTWWSWRTSSLKSFLESELF